MSVTKPNLPKDRDGKHGYSLLPRATDDSPNDPKIAGLPSINHRKVTMLHPTLGIILWKLSLSSRSALAREFYALVIGNGADENIDPLGTI